MKLFTFRGLIAPVLTPFNNNLGKTLKLEVIPAYAEYLKSVGIKGVLVNGTSGEGTLMNVKERKLVAEAWVTECEKNHLHCMIQVGGAPLPDVLELAKHAELLNVDSLLCLPELYHKPATAKELIHYLQLVSKAAPNTPLLYYHIPSLTNVHINMGTFLNEAEGKISTFSGIKFTSPCLDEGIAAVNAANGRFSVFLGADKIMAGAYALGFDSAIATSLNIAPNLGVNILDLCKEGKVKDARATQRTLNEAIDAITKHGTWVPTMKAAMDLFTPIKCGPPREPLVALNEQQIEIMKAEVKKFFD